MIARGAGSPGEAPDQAEDTREELLERTTELEALEAAVAQARGGEGALLTALAEGGLGKSRLIAEARRRAERAGLRVLRARGDDLEHDFPLGIALQLFEAELRGASEAERAELLAGAAAPAGALVAPAATGPAQRPHEEHALIHGLYWLVMNLADRGPLALLVDDAHWADPPSLRLLHYLARRLGGLGVLLVVAGRPAEPGGEGELLDRLSAAPGTRVIRPQPLSGGAVVSLLTEWLGAQPDPAFARACADTTGGNPLLLRELVSALGQEGVRPDAAGAQRVREVGPAPVSRSLALTLARLGPVATTVARAVAVLGEGAEYAQVARLAQVGLDEAVGAAGELSRAGILARGPRAAFAHPVLRQAVHEELDPGERSLAHHRAARIVAEAGVPPERVAAHLRASRPAGDPWASQALAAAARVVRGRGAPATAVGFLRRAIEEPPPSDARPGLVLELGQAEAAAGLPEATERLREAVALLDHDPTAQAEALRSLGRTLFYVGREVEAAEAFERALTAATGDGELSLELAADFAQAASWYPKLRARALRRLTPLLAGRRVAATTAERLALAHVAGDRFLKGHDREHVVALALRAWDGGALLGAGDGAEIAVFGLAGTLLHSDAFAEAERVIEAALADARARGAARAFLTMTYRRACLHRHLGRLDEAVADLERVVQARHEGWDAQLAGAFALLCECRLLRGNREAAGDALNLERRGEDRWPHTTAYALFRGARGELALAGGDARAALEDFEAAGTLLVEVMDAPNPSLSAWRSGAALASLALDDPETARARATEAVELARAFGAPRALGGALRALGLVHNGEQGVAHLEEAVGTLEDSPAELERAQAQVDLGAALRRSGRRADARIPLREGLDRADRAGAGSLAARAREELASAGARPRRARLSGPDALTPTERRVASMAASGMTNREIAHALFVTVKAVQWHLGHAYPKLGVSGREELPEALGPDSES